MTPTPTPLSLARRAMEDDAKAIQLARKARTKALASAWRAANREKCRAYNAAWRDRHRPTAVICACGRLIHPVGIGMHRRACTAVGGTPKALYVKATQSEAGESANRDMHVFLAERALGRRLPPTAEVHHLNENRRDNTPSNLVICQDGRFHKLLHRRTVALAACGHADWLKCGVCKVYDSPNNITVQGRRKKRFVHRTCERESWRKRRAAARGESAPEVGGG